MTEDGNMAKLPEFESSLKSIISKSVPLRILLNLGTSRGCGVIEKRVTVKLPTFCMGILRSTFYRSFVDDYLHLALCLGIGSRSGNAPSPIALVNLCW